MDPRFIQALEAIAKLEVDLQVTIEAIKNLRAKEIPWAISNIRSPAVKMMIVGILKGDA